MHPYIVMYCTFTASLLDYHSKGYSAFWDEHIVPHTSNDMYQYEHMQRKLIVLDSAPE